MGFRFWIVVAGVLGGLGVLMGAMGAHMFEGDLTGDKAVYFEKAWRYHMVHVMALLAAAWLVWVFDHGLEAHGSWSAHLAGVFFLIGIVLFSGVLYLMALAGGEPRVPLVPVGGVSFLLGWLFVVVSGLRIPRF